MEKITLNVGGMKCGGCETLIQDAVNACEGVMSVKANHQEGQVEIEFDPSKTNPERLKEVIVGEGYTIA